MSGKRPRNHSPEEEEEEEVQGTAHLSHNRRNRKAPPLSSLSSHSRGETRGDSGDDKTTPPISDGASSGAEGIKETRTRRYGTLYDAVAGRLTTSGFVDTPSNALPSAFRDTLSHGRIPLTPGEALFRHPRAPERFEEDDIYNAHRHLQNGDDVRALPSSDVLIAVHTYAADFYGALTGKTGRGGDWRSMDETALLAFGILLEEAAGAVLGECGDMVFVEGEGHGGGEHSRDTEGNGEEGEEEGEEERE